MDRLHHHGPLPYSRGNALDGAGADIADSEDTGAARNEGRAERPPLGINPGPNETSRIQRQAPSEPFGVGLSSYHDEEIRYVPSLSRSGAPVRPAHLAQEPIPFEVRDPRMRMHRNPRGTGDALHEIVRHRSRESATADDDMHMPRASRQEHGRLTGRIRSSYDRDLLSPAKPRLHRGRRVVDTVPLETAVGLDVELAIASAGCNHNTAGANSVTPVDLQTIGLRCTV
jgi:hypothetical protein